MAIITFEELQKIVRLERYEEIVDYINLIDEAIAIRWKKISAKYEGTGIDPADAEDDECEKLKLFKYRMNLMVICCLSETWEQDLANYLMEQGISVPNSDYAALKRAFNELGLSISLDDYTEICNMRNLVNYVKHGPGRSYDQLISSYGESILEDSNLGFISEDGSEHLYKQHDFDNRPLTSVVLHVDGKEKIYCEEIKKFWNDVFKEVALQTNDN